MSGVSWGLWVALVGVQSPRDAWAALRCARRWVMEKPAFPSSCESTTNTCLQMEPEKRRDNPNRESFKIQAEHVLFRVKTIIIIVLFY